jgi:hypothetical protein
MRSAGYLSAPAGTATLVLAPDEVTDSMSALAATYSRSDLAGVCVADGFGVRVVVERGALEVHDGVGPHRRSRRYDRATHGLRRLVILNGAGVVSLDALRWCHALGIGVLVLGPDGTVHLASTPRVATRHGHRALDPAPKGDRSQPRQAPRPTPLCRYGTSDRGHRPSYRCQPARTCPHLHDARHLLGLRAGARSRRGGSPRRRARTGQLDRTVSWTGTVGIGSAVVVDDAIGCSGANGKLVRLPPRRRVRSFPRLWSRR